MGLLNTADKVYGGDLGAADAVYMGDTLVWSGQTWTPKAVPGLLLWLDATQMVATDGDSIPAWGDSSDNGYYAATVSGTPIYRTNGINGHPSIRFGDAGILAGMRIAHGHSIGDRTVFQVIQATPGASFGPYHTTQIQEYDPFLQTYGPSAGTIHTYSTPDLDSGVPWSGACQFVTLWADSTAATHSLEVDGTQVSTSWTPGASNSDLFIGGFQPGGYAMNGFIGEVIFYERCLTATERATVQSYLGAKWAISGGSSAVRFSGSSKFTCSASGLTLDTTSITWCCWAKLDGDFDFYNHVMSSDDASSHYCGMGVSSGGTNFYVSNFGSSGFDFTPGVWTFIAATIDRTGAECWLYYAPTPATTLTRDFAYGNASPQLLDTNTFFIGNDGFGSVWNGSIAAVKVWNAVLTQAELEAEMTEYAPQRTANVWGAWKFDNGPQTTDDSGNGRTLTMAGTPVTDTSGPPIV